MIGHSAAKTPRNAAKIGDEIQTAQIAGWGLNSDFWPEYLPLMLDTTAKKNLLHQNLSKSL